MTPDFKSLRVEPYPYQREGIIFGLEKKRLIIGDEPGLGKTLQSIGVAHCARAYPCLVICPASLKINWLREFEKFTDARALILDNSTRTTWPYLLQMGMYQVVIVNYESLRKYFVWDILCKREQSGTCSGYAERSQNRSEGNLSAKGAFRLKDVVFCPDIRRFRSVIIDESHRVKDPGAQQTIFTKGITAGKPYVMLLSGTPVVNHPQDLVAQLSIIGRLSEFGGRAKFLADYGTPDSDLEDLSQRLYDSCLIRREKKSVLTDLPDKTRVDLYVDISNRQEYDVAEADLRRYLEEYTECTDTDIRRKMRMQALVRFMTLRALSAKGKVAQAVEFISNFMASDRPLVVFCSYHEIVDALRQAFPDAVSVTGRDSAIDKQAAVDAFQQGRARLIICSIKAAGVGLTLTAASSVAFIELPWTYADCCQCEDRCHRIGQSDNVTCYYLLGQHTIDRKLYQIIYDKKSIAARIMGTDDDIPTDSLYFDQLVNSFLAP